MARKRRLTAEQTRHKLIEAGLSLLVEHGIEIGLAGVTLEHAVVLADVPRSSGYAAFSTDDDFSPQELFQREVVLRAVEERHNTIEEIQELTVQILEEIGATVSRAELMSELCRVIATQNARTTANSRNWQLVIALRAVLVATPTPADPELAEWIAESEEEFRLETINDVYRPLGELIGMRPKPEYGEAAYQYVEIASSALSEGLAPRFFLRTQAFLEDIDRNGVPWSLFAIMFEEMVYTFFEPIDPDTWHTRPTAGDDPDAPGAGD